MAKNDSLIDAVRADPDTLWAILRSGVLVAGPWTTETRQSRDPLFAGREPTQWVRPHWDNREVLASVGRSTPLSEPDRWDYCDYVDEDDNLHTGDEIYECDLRRFREAMEKFKPWSYTVLAQRLGTVGPTGYADTPEEAMAMADKALKARGCLLAGGSNPA